MGAQVVTAWEIGFCINCKEQGRRERSWKAFHWNEQITRIN